MRGTLICLSTLLVLGYLLFSSENTKSQTGPNPVQPVLVTTVKSFGATGDGKTDDSAALQRAVDSKIGQIRFPKGVYRITKTINVDLDQLGPTSLSS
ncbi:MAG TPA: hypothetical protein DDZ90_22090, partial [Planctomycetaceae bacterium]|nr:hypothetical protein [Planctomycetaceae bacterium]